MPAQAASDLRQDFFPEVAAGGFTRVDGTIEFYQRVNALLREDMVVADFGAGRGEWAIDDPVVYRKRLRQLQGKVRRVVGCDVDPAVLRNPAVDEAVVLDPHEPLPFADASIDLLVADWVFEHVADPVSLCAQLDRVLKPGGWICARTTNRYGYVGLISTVIPNRWHARVVRQVQHQRRQEDVFPTKYRMNTAARIKDLFPADRYQQHLYFTSGEPSYSGNSRILWWLALSAHALLPQCLQTSMFLFLRKR